MTHHLDDGSLQALLDGEMSAGPERGAREHLATCIDCRGRLAELREANSSLAVALHILDPLPAGVLAPPHPGSFRPPSMGRRAGRWGGAGFARAATLLLTVTAAASATIPGSPVRGWLLERLGGGSSGVAVLQPEIAETAAAPMAAPEEVQSGVTVEPEAGDLRVVLLDVAPGVEVDARFVRDGRGGVFALGEAADARFQASAGVIEVRGVPGGELRVEIPRTTARATVSIDGTIYLEKDGEDLTINGESRQFVPEPALPYLLRP